MRLAIISDIHSNILALNNALDDLKKENVDKIIFLGDYISDGNNDNEILNIVKNISDYALLGNREKYMLDYSPLKKDFNNYKTIHTTYINLTKENKEYIKTLKESYIVQLGNYKVLMIHGDGYYKDKENINNIFDKIINDYDFDICLFGHSHKYLYKKYKNKYFINPGSIGEPTDDPSYKYCILDINDKIKVNLKKFSVQKTFKELEENYKNTKYYKDNYVWGNLTLYIIRDGFDYCALFIEMFNKKIKDIKNISSKEFNKIWNETYDEFINKYNL